MSAPEMPAIASVGLSTIGADGAIHVRAWEVPPEFASLFAADMHRAFGQPSEMVTDVETMMAGGRQAAADGAVILLRGEEDGHG